MSHFIASVSTLTCRAPGAYNRKILGRNTFIELNSARRKNNNETAITRKKSAAIYGVVYL